MFGSSMARAIPVALLTALLAAVPASGAKPGPPRSIYKSPLLWATVNVCDTPDNPDTIGIRESIPGSGVRGETMGMRYLGRVFSRGQQRWHNMVEGADSGRVAAGSARYRARQAASSFPVPAA